MSSFCVAERAARVVKVDVVQRGPGDGDGQDGDASRLDGRQHGGQRPRAVRDAGADDVAVRGRLRHLRDPSQGRRDALGTVRTVEVEQDRVTVKPGLQLVSRALGDDAASASPNCSSSSPTRRRRFLPRIPYRLPCMVRFSWPVSWPTALVCWLTEPVTDRTRPGCLSTSMPATRALPSSGRDSVVRILTVVVLPAPFGPSSAYTLPAATEKVSPSSASTADL